MPTYRYRCAKCGDETEIWQSFAEKPKTRHAGGCGGKLTKVLSPAGIVLKGSGFYKTDSRSAARSGAKQSESGNGSDGASTSSESSSSSETKKSGNGAKDNGAKDNGAKKESAASTS
jgi:putative FmdB family regulatory protein